MARMDNDFGGDRRAFVAVFATTLLCMASVGAVLPVLPLYVRGPFDAGNLAVGVVVGVYSVTGLAGRPFAGRLADIRGRRPALLLGSFLTAAAGLLYLLPAGMTGLIAARLVHGAGEGMVFTAGSAWIVDLARPDRRARVIGLYGLAVWTGLSLGPPIGDALLRAFSFEMVWVFAAVAPLVGAAVASQVQSTPGRDEESARGPLIARESLRPGAALAMASVGYAAVAGFVVLHLESRGVGDGAGVFAAFAAMVVLTRLVAGDLPDRIGPARCAIAATAVEAIGLCAIAFAQSVAVAVAGALAMGAAFSLLYPSLSLIVVERVPENRRGAALGTFTACFDAGVGVGALLAGAIATLSGYQGAFLMAAAFALAAGATVALAVSARGRSLVAGRR